MRIYNIKWKILGIVPKSYIPNYSEFYEKRWFTEGFNIKGLNVDLDFQKEVPFGTDLIFSFKNLKVGFEICEDLWVTIPPSSNLALMGANLICNLSASNELVSKSSYRKSLVQNQMLEQCVLIFILQQEFMNQLQIYYLVVT